MLRCLVEGEDNWRAGLDGDYSPASEATDRPRAVADFTIASISSSLDASKSGAACRIWFTVASIETVSPWVRPVEDAVTCLL